MRQSRATAALILALSLAAAGSAAAGEKKSVVEQGASPLVPPSFLKGKAISPDAPETVPVLFIFSVADDIQAKSAVKKADAALAKNPTKNARVVLVVGGADQAECKKNALALGAPHLDILADPAGLLQAQFGFKIDDKNPIQMRVYHPDGRVDIETNGEDFLKSAEGKAAAPAAKGKDAKPAAKKDQKKPDAQQPAVAEVRRSGSPRLKEAYAMVEAGEKAKALSKFRPVAGDKSGKETEVVAEAKAMVSQLEGDLDDKLRALRSNPSDQYVADLENARTTLAAAWKDDGKSKNKVDAFVKEWEKKDEVKNEYAARKTRLRIWQAMGAPKPDRMALAQAFQDIAEKCPGTATGIQAAALANVLGKKK